MSMSVVCFWIQFNLKTNIYSPSQFASSVCSIETNMSSAQFSPGCSRALVSTSSSNTGSVSAQIGSPTIFIPYAPDIRIWFPILPSPWRPYVYAPQKLLIFTLCRCAYSVLIFIIKAIFLLTMEKNVTHLDMSAMKNQTGGESWDVLATFCIEGVFTPLISIVGIVGT